MGKYFGTDGVRGAANAELTPELAFKLGRAGGYVLSGGKEGAKVVVGKDTRRSGDMLEAALIAGLASVGVDAVKVGVLPTPGVAYLTRKLGASAGAMISASHNPFEDNGIKFFGGAGFKLLDEEEARIEALLDAEKDELPRPQGKGVGIARGYEIGASQYADFLAASASVRLDGLKIALDCANGAAFEIAPLAFRALGAEIAVSANAPDGLNINVACGSTHPEELQKLVVREGADLGLAFDGDADRLIAVDEKGAVVDGDQILFILAKKMKEKGKLEKGTLVTTVMSNFGLKEALKKEGVAHAQTAVGDRYVIEEMRKNGFNLGGEQSGHMILLDHNTTGDGVLAAVQIACAVKEKGEPLSKMASEMRKFPQVMVNVRVEDKEAWKTDESVGAAIEEGERALEGNGRVLIRPSGTEPLVRVMAEGANKTEIEAIVNNIAGAIKNI